MRAAQQQQQQQQQQQHHFISPHPCTGHGIAEVQGFEVLLA